VNDVDRADARCDDASLAVAQLEAHADADPSGSDQIAAGGRPLQDDGCFFAKGTAADEDRSLCSVQDHQVVGRMEGPDYNGRSSFDLVNRDSLIAIRCSHESGQRLPLWDGEHVHGDERGNGRAKDVSASVAQESTRCSAGGAIVPGRRGSFRSGGVLETPPQILGAPCSSRRSHARAIRQSRATVSGATCST